MKNYNEISNSEKVAIVNKLISVCELIANNNHQKNSISWDIMVQLRSWLRESNIDEYMYEVIDKVVDFLKYRN